MRPQRHCLLSRPLLVVAVLLSPCLLVSLSPCLLQAAETGLLSRWPAKPGAADQEFDGGRFVVLTPAPSMGKGPFSIAVWVNAGDLSGGNAQYGRGIARSTRNEQIGDWLLSVHPDGRLRFCNWRKPGDDNTGSHLTRDPVIVPDAWYHVAATWDGKTNRLFINGVEGQYSNGATAAGWGPGHEVGRCWTQADYFWSGLIDDLRIYSRPLDPVEIKKDYQANPHTVVRKEVKPAGDLKISAGLDLLILDQLKKHNLQPAPQADDAEFYRRAMLDLAGRIPSMLETETFLADKAPDKRHQLIDSLLAGRDMPIYWSQVLSGWLMPKEGRRDPAFLGYLRSGLARNKPWDDFVREMLIARPASQFLSYRKAALKDNTIAKDVGRAFFGVNLRCAQCHDHPHVKAWTSERFYGLSAFFARSYEYVYTDAANQKHTVFAEKMFGELEYLGADHKKKIAPAMFLDGKQLTEPPADKNAKEPPPAKNAAPPVPAFSRREALARLALDRQSPYVKRALVNRVWQRLMGRALVEPVDMMYDGNPATHPELLDFLADDFADHAFDLRRLISVIMQSHSYARSSRWPGPGPLPKETLYAVAILKPLDAEQLALSVPLATGYQDGQISKGKLPPIAPWVEVLKEFETQGEEFEPTVSQALFLLNSNYVQTHFLAKSKLAQALTALQDDTALVRRAYLTVLSRLPSPEEVSRVSRYLSERGTKARAEACREVIWALISGAEFRFNH